jgi:hypothetical protein
MVKSPHCEMRFCGSERNHELDLGCCKLTTRVEDHGRNGPYHQPISERSKQTGTTIASHCYIKSEKLTLTYCQCINYHRTTVLRKILFPSRLQGGHHDQGYIVGRSTGRIRSNFNVYIFARVRRRQGRLYYQYRRRQTRTIAPTSVPGENTERKDSGERRIDSHFAPMER